MKNWILILAALLIAGLPLWFHPDAEFAGTDAGAEAVVEEISPDYEPWAEPLVGDLPSEVESGLFALQAALGAGLLGYTLGKYRARNESA